jgi:hypothetical protein
MTSTPSEPVLIGMTSVRILVPSRRHDGGVVSADHRREWEGRTFVVLSEKFGGASPQTIVGSFVHADNRVTREEIKVYASSCSSGKIADERLRGEIIQFARELCAALGQEGVFVGWGDASYVVSSTFNTNDIPVVPFSSLSDDARAQHLTMGWGGIENPSKILQVLSLDMWTMPDTVVPEDTRLILQARHPEESRRAWSWKGTLEEFDAARKAWKSAAVPAEGDLVFLTGADPEMIDVAIVGRRKIFGPRGLRRSAGSLNPVTRHLLYRILDRDWAGLERDLTQKNLDKQFFQQLRKLQAELQQHATRSVGPKRAFEISVVFIGRMMFLRFLAQKGWLPGGVDAIVAAQQRLGPRFFGEYIRPLWFDVLNAPVAARSSATREAFAGFPYLNGGLFQQIEGEESLVLPPPLFDPAVAGSFLHLFQQFEFSLNEHGGSDETLRIDPSLFGQVLESFNSDSEKKKDGIHYTPKKIALALAQEGIVARLQDLTDVSRDSIDGVARGRYDTVTPAQADQIKTAVERLRIVDPAVGSGVLLWAALDVLLRIHSVCDGIVSGSFGYRPGTRGWGRWSRHFVQHCLFGVDISAEGVALTRLRLWLSVALSEDEPRALPDLQLNIVVGDSLGASPDWAASTLPAKQGGQGAPVSPAPQATTVPAKRTTKKVAAQAKKTAARVGTTKKAKARATDRQFHLILEDVDRKKNDLLSLLLDYERTGDADAPRQRDLRVRIENARAAVAGREGRPPEFSWSLFFPQVFGSEKKGFDVVIANPPYIRVQNIDPATKVRWPSIANRNADLSYAFIELALRQLAAPDRGQVAYIQPNFRHHDAASTVRQMLMGQHADVAARLRLWVDFDDQQVFDTATNYVAMLFAERLPSPKAAPSFEYSGPRFSKSGDDDDIAWLRPVGATHAHPTVDEWLTVERQLREAVIADRARFPRCLGDLAVIEVGVQTSCDDVFLFEDCQPAGDGTVLVRQKGASEPVRIETELVRECKKGSSAQPRWLLLPYREDGKLLEAADLKKRFPLAWRYLTIHRATLEEREKGAFRDDSWFRLGRNQGVVACFRPKLLVPSLLKEPSAMLDAGGQMAFTASGKGGGGAWCVRPRDGVTLEQLYEVLVSDVAWAHIRAFGSPQQGGWRGVDQRVLEGIPCL